MTTLTWVDNFNTGVDALDIQRRKIFVYMTTICNGLEDNLTKCSHFNGMLDQLELLCQMHFMDEERLMEEINFPLAAEHKHLHDLFLAIIDRFKIDSNQCHTPSIIKDFNNIREDFITLMLTESMILRDFIKAKIIDNS